jgi:UDP-N-acetyl-D-galactosamine dehydrogenase
MKIYEDLISGEKSLSLIGLGYVGLPIALAFARKIKVIGFDINDERVEMMKKDLDPSNELEPEAFHSTDIKFTSDKNDLREASFHIVAVPTPITRHKLPDLHPLLSATRTVGSILKKGDYVVYESTVHREPLKKTAFRYWNPYQDLNAEQISNSVFTGTN